MSSHNPARTPGASKLASSRLLTMKFMQKLPSSPSKIDAAINKAAIAAAIVEEEAKHEAAMDAAFGGERWRLDIVDDNPIAPTGEIIDGIPVVFEANSQLLDDSESDESDDRSSESEDGGETEKNWVLNAKGGGRRYFGDWKKKTAPKTPTKDKNDQSDSEMNSGEDLDSPSSKRKVKKEKEANRDARAYWASRQQAASTSAVQCYNCGESGHIRRDCTKAKSGAAGSHLRVDSENKKRKR